MTVSVRPLRDSDIPGVVEFSLRAWQPVFESFQQVMGPAIFSRVYRDWRAGQARAVEETCREHLARSWVADEDGHPVGFVVVVLLDRDGLRSGEIEMVAVDPRCQNQGIGLRLVTHAVAEMGRLGLPLAEIGTGGDPGHAAARHVYEKAGFTAMPQVRYYKALPGG
jgi:ribosomal protein S18 acetylase RimI-like enzyme